VVWGRAVQDDKQFRVSGNWALASDGIQCIIQKWAGNKWRASSSSEVTRHGWLIG
jgi:hypothetical protein